MKKIQIRLYKCGIKVLAKKQPLSRLLLFGWPTAAVRREAWLPSPPPPPPHLEAVSKCCIAVMDARSWEVLYYLLFVRFVPKAGSFAC